MRYLIVVDMQNDFVTGSLGSKMAEMIVPAVCEKIRSYKAQEAEAIGGSAEIYEKSTFGSAELAQHLAEITKAGDEIELCGLCTDICVVSNALLIKAFCPECEVIVDANACAGVTEESHKAALVTMASCQCRIDNF